MVRQRNRGWLSRLWGGVFGNGGSPRRKRKLAAPAAVAGLLCGLFLLASCAAPTQGSLIGAPRFHEAANADLIFRYFSDNVSHVEKPLTMEGPFLVACERAMVLKLAANQPRHELAVVLLVHYFSLPEENRIKLAWKDDLTKLGYHTVVFLLAGPNHQIDGLPILPEPQAVHTVAQQ